jgi:hypothetical protein
MYFHFAFYFSDFSTPSLVNKTNVKEKGIWILLPFFFFGGGIGVLNSGPWLAGQVLHHLSHTSTWGFGF